MSDNETPEVADHYEDLADDAFPESGWGKGRSKQASTILAEEDLLTAAKRQEEGAKGIVLHDPVARYGFAHDDKGVEKTKDKLRTAADNLDVSVDMRPVVGKPYDLAIRVVARRTRERKPKEENGSAPATGATKATKAAAKK